MFTLVILGNLALADEQANEKMLDEVKAEIEQTFQQQEIKPESELTISPSSQTECLAIIPEVTSIEVAEALAAKGFQIMGTKQAQNSEIVKGLIFKKESDVESGIVSKHVVKSKLQVIAVNGDQKSVINQEELATVRCNDLESHECVEKIETEHNAAMAKLAEKASPADCVK